MSEKITEIKTVLNVRASEQLEAEINKDQEEAKANETQESSIKKFLRARGRRNNTNGSGKTS